jgi:hypothetical protein
VWFVIAEGTNEGGLCAVVFKLLIRDNAFICMKNNNAKWGSVQYVYPFSLHSL